MKIPDKIYCGNNGHGNLSYSSEKIYDSMQEYIRKDALLEYLNGLDTNSNYKQFVIDNLIEHIESL